MTTPPNRRTALTTISNKPNERESRGDDGDEEMTTRRPASTQPHPPRPVFLRGSSSSGTISATTTFSFSPVDTSTQHRRTSSSEETTRDNFLFTPAGDTLPPIATSRSTTALLTKKKQLHGQSQAATIAGMYPWTGHINGASSSSSGANHPTPDHPPPPYTEVAPGRPSSSTQPPLLLPPSLLTQQPTSSPTTPFHHHARASSASSSSSTPYGSQPPSRTHSASFSSYSFTSPAGSSSSVRGLLRRGRHDDAFTSSSSEDDAGDREGGGAIYTSPSRSRTRKGKERASDVLLGEEYGYSSAIHIREGERPSLTHHQPGNSEGDPGGVTTPQVKKSCLKTPASSSASLASLGESSSKGEQTSEKVGLGVRFVRFTLGLGGKSGKRNPSREREREPKLICTTPGEACAGETETETDEPSRSRLPTARRPPPSSSSFGFGSWRRSPAVPVPKPPPPVPTYPPPPRSGVGPSPLRPTPPSTTLNTPLQSPTPEAESRFTPFLFEAFRLLSVVPAICGVLFSLWMIYSMGGLGSASEAERGREHMLKYWRCVPFNAPTTGVEALHQHLCRGAPGVLKGPPVPGRVDWVVAVLWALLTAHHCLGLSTGLLARWKVYYTPASTVVRLLALQGICWPATHLTLSVVGGAARPVAAWAVIGTCTAVSRSVQIWVTSNIVVRDDSSDDAEEDVEETEDEVLVQSQTKTVKKKKSPGERMVRFLHAFAAAVGGGGSSEGELGEESDEDDQDGDGRPVPVLPLRQLVEEDSMFESTDAESSPLPGAPNRTRRRRRRRRRRQLRERWWDWKEVGLKCMLPTGMAYFVMAWAEVLRREFV